MSTTTTQLDREGTFEARVVDAEMYTAESGAVAVNLEFEVLRQYDKPSKTYTDWPAGYRFKGSVWLVKKGGEIIPDNIKRLKRSIGWNGNPDEIASVIGAACKCDVKRDDYNGHISFKAAFINPAGEVDVSAINEQYGATFMAYAAEVGHVAPASAPGAASATGSAPAPATAPAPAPPPPPAAEFAADPNDKVPF